MFRMPRLLLTIFALLFAVSSRADVVVTGTVVDDDTDEPLPIVNISVNGNAFRGVYADPRGFFSIDVEHEDKFLVFTYVGYKTLQLPITPAMLEDTEPIEVRLEEQRLEVEEVVVSAKWNPAYVIMKRAVERAAKYNPDRLESYKTSIYSKMKIKLDIDTTQEGSSWFNGFYEAFDGYYLYVTEKYADRYYQAPNDIKNIIYANNVAGYELPEFSLNFDNIAPFHFYDDFIRLYSKRYLNPLSKGAEKGYFFSLKDTVTMADGRAAYHIHFFPEKLVNFNPLEGDLFIDTADYAVAKVYAAPKVKEIVDVKLEQEYRKVNDSIWFPSLIKTKVFWPKFPDEHANVLIYSDTYPRDLVLDPDLAKDSVVMDEFLDEYRTQATRSDTNYWDSIRVQNLSESELRSYEHIDSLSQEYHVEAITKAIGKTVREFSLPLGYVDVDVSKLYYFDNYQKHRLGYGFSTSPLLFKNFQLGWYQVYGTGDKRWKSGFRFRLLTENWADLNLTYSFLDDVEEPTRLFPEFDRRFHIIRDIIIDKYNYNTQHILSFGQRIKYFKYRLQFKSQAVESQYRLGRNQTRSEHEYSEFELDLKYAPHEKVTPIFGSEMILPSLEPVFYFKLQQGVDNLLEGDNEYLRLSALYMQNFSLFRYGNLSLALEGGYSTMSDYTYHKMFSGRGANTKGVRFYIPRTFTTMYQYEFTNSSYVNLFLRHSLEPFTFGNQYFKPTLSFFQSIGFGWLDDGLEGESIYEMVNGQEPLSPENLQDMSKGYFETGFSLLNIARLRLGSFGYMGLGIHMGYRWGAYHLDNEFDNYRLSLGMRYSF